MPFTLGAAPPHRPNVPLAPTGTALQGGAGHAALFSWCSARRRLAAMSRRRVDAKAL